METGPFFWFGLFFLAAAVLGAVYPFVSWSRYKKRAARSARVGGHVLDVETERTGSGEHVSYVHHTRVTYESADGRRITTIITLDDSIDPGAEVWLLHDPEDPWEVELEREPQWLRTMVRGSVFGISLLLFGAYAFFAAAGLLPYPGFLTEEL